LLPSFKLYILKLEITATITLVNQLFLGGQHTPIWGGQYAPFSGGHFNPELGGQFERFFHSAFLTQDEIELTERRMTTDL